MLAHVHSNKFGTKHYQNRQFLLNGEIILCRAMKRTYSARKLERHH